MEGDSSDDIFKKIGEYGFYQKIMTLLIAIIISGTSSNVIELIFTCYIPTNYRCVKVNSSVKIDLNISDTCSIDNITSICEDWFYESKFVESSIVTLFDLYCDKEWLASMVITSYMIGNFVCSLTSIFWDKYGRRKLLFAGLVLNLVSRIGSAFSMNLWLYLLFRFLIGAATTLMYISGYVLACELVSHKYTPWVGTLSATVWSISATILPAIAYFVRTKQNYELIGSYLFFFGLLIFWFIPESPKWLIANNRHLDAISIYENIAAKNGIKNCKLTRNDVELIKDTREESFLHFLKHKELLKNTVILYLYWFTVSLAYYGITLNIGSMAGNIYLNSFIVCLLDVVANLLGYFPVYYIGRKWVALISMCVPGILLFCILFIPFEKQLFITGISITGKGFVSFAFLALYIYTVELFPTSVRATGVGVASLFARLGGMVAPFILKIYGVVFGFVTLGILAIVSGLLVSLLPDTRNKVSPEIISDCLSKMTVNLTAEETLITNNKDGNDEYAI